MTKAVKPLKFLPYCFAAAVLCVFSYLNYTEYKAYITDLQNSNGISLTVGDTLSNYMLTSLDGKLLKSEAIEKPYVAVIATPKCPYVAEALNNIEKVNGIIGVNDVKVIYIGATSHDMNNILALQEKHAEYCFYFDTGNSLKWQLKPKGYPTILVVDNNEIIYKSRGYTQNLEKALAIN